MAQRRSSQGVCDAAVAHVLPIEKIPGQHRIMIKKTFFMM
jgi:hypothetical protein